MVNMIRLQDIIQQFPPKLHDFPRAILREYLQYKILASTFSHPLSQKLCFIGGTALRIWYHSQRFSEDIDFDNWWLTQSDFESITSLIKKDLQQEGYEVEMRSIYKWAFHCTIKIPQILFDNDLASMANEKLVIKIDTTPQWYEYIPDMTILQWFGITSPYRLVPKDILFSMKLRAFFWRIKWRDIFDIVYLLSLWLQPHRWFCDYALGINNPENLKKALIRRIELLDLPNLQKDVQPFLFDSNNRSVTTFPQIIAQSTFY